MLSMVGTILLSSGIIHAEEAKHDHGFRNPGYVNQDSYTSNNIYEVENLAYYGDWDSNRVFAIDVDNMKLLTIVEDTGDGPYGIDQQGTEKAYHSRERPNHSQSLIIIPLKTPARSL